MPRPVRGGAGQTVLVLGAAGGVGVAAIQVRMPGAWGLGDEG
jgi:NADPH:quinone reductase-like Zn-dependent oxidoreductase